MLLQAARLLILGPVLLAPWLLGSAEPYLNRWLAWSLVAGALAYLGHAIRSGQIVTLRLSVLATLTGVGAFFGVLQCLRIWPTNSAWSPGVARLWGELSALQPGELAPATLSGAATIQLSAWLLLAAVEVTLAPALFASLRAASAFFAAVTINGVLLVLFMLVQFASWNGHIYWVGPELDRRVAAYGPFVYHNQAANYFAVALACLAGWWIASGESVKPKARSIEPTDRQLLGGPPTTRVVQLLCLVALLVGLFAAESRGAVVAAVFALAIGLFTRLDRMRLGRSNHLALFGSLAIAAAIAWFAVSDGPADRYATLLEEDALAGDSRLTGWSNALQAIGSIGLLGGGLGAYRHTVQAFQVEPTPYEFQNAHNQYLEALVDGGPLALVLVLAAIAFAARRTFIAGRSSRRLLGSVGLVGLTVLVFQAVQGMVDFCLYLPAAFLPTALLIGLGASASRSRSRERSPSSPPASASVGLRNSLAIGLLAVAPLSAMVLHRYGSIDRELVRLPIVDGRLEATDDRLQTHIESLQRVLNAGGLVDRFTPRDGVAYETLGDLLVTRYRRAAQRTLAEDLGLEADNPSLAPWTTPTVLFRKAHEAIVAGDREKLVQIREQPLVVEHLIPAYAAYREALHACPMLERAAVRTVELAFVTEGLEESDRLDRLIALARRVGGTRAGSLYALGNLALLSDRLEIAWDAWGSAMRISRRNEQAIAVRAAQSMPAERFVSEVLPADPKRLVHLGIQALDAPQLAVAQAATLAQAESLLSADDADLQYGLRPGERWSMIADCRVQRGDAAGAIEALERALQENPSRIEDRFALAKLLAEVGRVEEALREARFCARAKPSANSYTQLARRLEERVLDRGSRAPAGG